MVEIGGRRGFHFTSHLVSSGGSGGIVLLVITMFSCIESDKFQSFLDCTSGFV